MSDKKLVVVFGATGNQGGSVVSTWMNNPELRMHYSLRGVTRDVTKPAARDLQSKGIEVVAADMNDSLSLGRAVEGAYAVFAVTNFWEDCDAQKELARGIAIANAVFEHAVKHFVWSSLPHTTKLTEGKLPNIDHFVAKAEVEEYIEANKSKSGTAATYFMAALFMSNYAGMEFIAPDQDGKLTLAMPYSATTRHPLIDIRSDVGLYVWGIIEAGKEADGKRVHGVGDWKTSQEIVDTFSQYGGCGEVKFVEIPRDVFKGFLSRKMGDVLGEEMTQNMDLISQYSYFGRGSEERQADSDEFLYKGSRKTSLRQFVQEGAPFTFEPQERRDSK